MSLLNDALRAAEERQQRPDVASAYTGQSVQAERGRGPWLVIAVLLVLLIAAGVGLYWFMNQNVVVPPSAIASADTDKTKSQGTVERLQPQAAKPPSATNENGEAPIQPVPSAREPEPASSREETTEAMPKTSEAVADVEPAPVTSAEPSPVSEPSAPSTPRTTEPQTSQAPANTETAPVSEPEQQSEQASEPEPQPVVKTTPRSPEAIDRATARELESWLASGRLTDAERRLAGLTQDQAAPRSRFVVARALLVEGEASRALSWLPESAAASDAPLRMLRARALHQDGQLASAVATLQSRVPSVDEQPEYRVTLATLLQQQGQSQEAARHWAELIAWDDTRAPWWVGLAIALEDQGQNRSAARAYEQAAALPGLPPSLADFVQRRLQLLGAG